MAITSKREKFCQSIAAGSNQSDAYRAAFNCSTMNARTINSRAYDLMQNSEIRDRLEQIKSELAESGLWTREQSVAALVSVVKSHDKTSDVVAAVKELNAMHGFNAPQKIQHSGDEQNPVAVKQLIAKDFLSNLFTDSNGAAEN